MERLIESGEGPQSVAHVATVEAAIAAEPRRNELSPAVATVTHAPELEPVAVTVSREVGSERALAMLLRAGGILGGMCFLASLPLSTLPDSERVHVAVDLLQKAGASFLIVTPMVRLGAAGVLLGMRGEYRYLAFAVASVGLLVAALSAGYGA